MPVVFVDVVWLVNLVMDAVILALAAWMARKRVGWRRIALGSVLGASYALLLFVPAALTSTMNVLTKLLFSCLMVWITFRPKTAIEFLRLFGLFYLASFVVGGAAYGLNALFAKPVAFGGMVFVAHQSWWQPNIVLYLVLSAIPVVYGMGKAAWNRVQRQKNRESNLWQVRITLDGKQAEFTGLLDTGNALVDPLSGLPVAVVEWQALEPLLPQPIVEAFLAKRDVTLDLGTLGLEGAWQSRLRIVPYRGVGGTVGMLLAFRPAEFVIHQGEAVTAVPNILVAINPKPLAGDRGYRAILPPACLTDSDVSISA
ncbi:sigma-E processing peptidase SpoIIGA [Effusibacillus pohliae]|uniref:sigma-E processing peptidase SpoIIGA n=1 Tax=Effusibacillus pohliae TaxID=232270 RepID=UPI0003631CE6|nr:sigma-E processing peptidase SpoIIGA [Effusibacillus pohliae]